MLPLHSPNFALLNKQTPWEYNSLSLEYRSSIRMLLIFLNEQWQRILYLTVVPSSLILYVFKCLCSRECSWRVHFLLLEFCEVIVCLISSTTMLESSNMWFRWQKVARVAKKKSVKCYTMKSTRDGTFLSGTYLSPQLVLLIVGRTTINNNKKPPY